MHFAPFELGIGEREGDWLDKNVGVKGSHISGGQKQRVAVLRTLYRSPRLFLLDEATSALDARNEEMVMQSLERVCGGRTVVNVTHKLQALRNYDSIIVLRRGEIVEVGSFEELIQRNGEFHELLKGK